MAGVLPLSGLSACTCSACTRACTAQRLQQRFNLAKRSSAGVMMAGLLLLSGLSAYTCSACTRACAARRGPSASLEADVKIVLCGCDDGRCAAAEWAQRLHPQRLHQSLRKMKSQSYACVLYHADGAQRLEAACPRIAGCWHEDGWPATFCI